MPYHIRSAEFKYHSGTPLDPALKCNPDARHGQFGKHWHDKCNETGVTGTNPIVKERLRRSLSHQRRKTSTKPHTNVHVVATGRSQPTEDMVENPQESDCNNLAKRAKLSQSDILSACRISPWHDLQSCRRLALSTTTPPIRVASLDSGQRRASLHASSSADLPPPATGCISIGTRNGATIVIERVMEQVILDAVRRTCVIIADILIHNSTDTPQLLYVVHRGTLTGRVVTNAAWSATNQPDTNRLVDLHQLRDPIRQEDRHVRINDQPYEIWPAMDNLATTVVGAGAATNVPYTMWEIGPFAAERRSIVRLELTMAKDTFDLQLGDCELFYAYGDAILLSEIEEDLSKYQEEHSNEARLFEEGLRSFKNHLLPVVFEWLLIEAGGDPRHWESSSGRFALSKRIVPMKYASTTHWFIADYSHGGRWRVAGRRKRNAFSIRFQRTAPTVVPQEARL